LLALESAVVPLDDVDAKEEPKTNRPAVAVKPAALPDELIPKKG